MYTGVRLTSIATYPLFRLDADGNIKVADFGLSEDVYTTGYFRQGRGNVKLPFKWMAPESMTDGIFNEKTDVVCTEVSHCTSYLPTPALEISDLRPDFWRFPWINVKYSLAAKDQTNSVQMHMKLIIIIVYRKT